MERLDALLRGCGSLTSLRLSACKFLEDAALEPLLEPASARRLRELDVSYCPLSTAALRQLLARGRRLTVLNLRYRKPDSGSVASRKRSDDG